AGAGSGSATAAAGAGAPPDWSEMYTRASSREGKSIALPHFGQLKRAWTGGIFAREIEKLPAQFGQENPYLRSSSLNGVSSKEESILARGRVASDARAYDPSPMTPLSWVRRIADRLRRRPVR